MKNLWLNFIEIILSTRAGVRPFVQGAAHAERECDVTLQKQTDIPVTERGIFIKQEDTNNLKQFYFLSFAWLVIRAPCK
jgi:hypothetical protein